MVKERGLDSVPIYNADWKVTLLGFLFAFIHPFVCISLLVRLFKADWNKPLHLIKMLLSVPLSFSIAYRLKKMAPDVVHLFWGHYPSVTGCLLCYLLPKTKVTMFLGAYDLEMELGVSFDLAKSAEIIFTHSDYNVGRLLKFGISKNKIKVIYRGVDINKLGHYCHTSKNKYQLLTAGRLISDKNFDLVIKSFSEAYKLNDRLSLKIAGEGPDKSRLESIVEELNLEGVIEFTGFLTQAELLVLMSQSTVFIFLSSKLGERLPNVVKEAMLASCRCIVSNTPGIDELIKNEKEGYILEHISSENVVEKIMLAVESSNIEVPTFAREKIINEFDSKKCMSKYLKFWNDLFSI